VSIGIDPAKTKVSTEKLMTLPDGRELIRITFKPQDLYGNYLGPGRLGSFEVQPQQSSSLIGEVRDLGNGSYEQEVIWDPNSVNPPLIGIAQPERPSVIIGLIQDGGPSITQIKVHIKTGNKDPNKNMRVYLGFEGKHGREFRMRTTDDANPFRENTALDIIFGSGANVRDKNINDPRDPPMDKTQITGAYIRIEPRQEEPWKIASAQVFINGSRTPTFSLKLPNIVLEDDAGEKVSLG
jgi:hypothetical protein